MAEARLVEGGDKGSISDRYVVPPFTVLDTRIDYGRKRRRWWLSLGIRAELGRGATVEADRACQRYPDPDVYRKAAAAASNVTGAAELPDYADFGMTNVAPGTSIFDPVLCEMMYRWFAPPGGTVLDPFAGGSVRGITAAVLGHPYHGIDLSPLQVAANREQAATILTPDQPQPVWTVGDSAVVLPTIASEPADLVMTCPPYYDLEVYSDDPADLSNLPTYDDFRFAYRAILNDAVRVLRRDRFAVVVVSEVRDRRGRYIGLVPDTIAALEMAGASFYNEAVLINPAGTLPMRVGKQFEASRKLGRMHQNIIIAIKGDPPRGWDPDRAHPPDPQLGMFAPEDAL